MDVPFYLVQASLQIHLRRELRGEQSAICLRCNFLDSTSGPFRTRSYFSSTSSGKLSSLAWHRALVRENVCVARRCVSGGGGQAVPASPALAGGPVGGHVFIYHALAMAIALIQASPGANSAFWGASGLWDWLLLACHQFVDAISCRGHADELQAWMQVVPDTKS